MFQMQKSKKKFDQPAYVHLDQDESFIKRKEKMEKSRKSKCRIFMSKDIDYGQERKELFPHFVKYIIRAMSLTGDYKVYIVSDRHRYGIKTTADYLDESKSMYVYAKDRSFIDVLRSIAHEFVHAKQHEVGLKFDHYLHFDNDLEDEANSIAGEMVNAYTEVMGHDKLYEN